jgi:aldehyde dehydrogenase (NAD+)
VTISGGPDATQLLRGFLLIGDERLERSSEGRHQHISPLTGAAQAEVPLAGAAEMDRAVRAAREALPAWRRVPGDDKRNLLLRLAQLIEDNADEFTQIAAIEAGVPVRLGGGIASAARTLRYFAGWADKIGGETIPTFPHGGFDYTIHEPYGVVAVLIPWNFPLIASATKLGPALAAGNTVVLKPPELAPFACLRLGELILEAGISPGVVNIVPGGPAGGSALVAHSDVDKISFTGGGETAKKIMRAAAECLTPLALELGGKSANLLFADAEMDKAIQTSAFFGMAMVSGQGCSLPTRLLVEESIYDEVVERVAAFAEKVVVGDPRDQSTVMGPVISQPACDRILSMVDEAVTSGAARLAYGGSRVDGELASGYYIQPTILADVDPLSTIAQKEVFGPVLSVLPFRTEEEAVSIANNTEFGLAAFVHSRDVGRVHRLANELDAGGIWVNGFRGTMSFAPFGGRKNSGFGRDGGRAGLEEFLHPKNVFIDL